MNRNSFLLLLSVAGAIGFLVITPAQVDVPAVSPSAEGEPRQWSVADDALKTADEPRRATVRSTETAAREESPERALVGRLVSVGGDPIPDGIVHLCEPAEERSTSRTDADGRFRLPLPHGRRVRLALRATGCAARDATVDLPRGQPSHDTGEWVLQPSAGLSGIVVDTDGAAVARAEIVLIREGMESIRARELSIQPEDLASTSDPDGNFHLVGLTTGPFRLRVRHPSHLSRDVIGELRAPGVTRDFEIVLQKGRSIRGLVVARSALAMPAALEVVARAAHGSGSVQTIASSGECDSEGEFSVDGLDPTKTYNLFVRHRIEGLSSVAPWLAGPVSARPGESGLDIVLGPLGGLQLLVLDGDSGEGIEGAEIRLQRWQEESLRASSRADQVAPVRETGDGRYWIHDMPLDIGEGQLGLSVTKSTYATFVRRNIETVPDSIVDLGAVRLRKRALLRARAVDASTGEPLEDAEVLMAADLSQTEVHPLVHHASRLGETQFVYDNPTERVRTDQSGEALIPLSANDQNWLAARHRDYALTEPVRISIDAASGELEHEFRLDRGGTLRVLVHGSSGLPRAGIEIERELDPEEPLARLLEGTDPPSRDIVATDETGLAEFPLLPPAFHRVRLAPSRDSFLLAPWHDVLVEAGGNHEIRWVENEAGTLHGQILLNGLPLRGAELVLLDDATSSSIERSNAFGSFSASGRSTHTDDLGEYDFERVPSGAYVLQVLHEKLRLASEEKLEMDSIDTKFDVLLETGRVTGTLRDEFGHGLGDAQVCVRSAGDVVSIVQGALPYARATQFWVRSDERGRYAIDGIRAERLLVVLALAEDRQPVVSEEFRLTAGQQRSVDLELRSGGTIEVHIASARGIPALFAGVQLIEASYEGDLSAVVTDRVGRTSGNAGRPVVFRHLTPGTWRLGLVNIHGEPVDTPEQLVAVQPRSTAIARFDVP